MTSEIILLFVFFSFIVLLLLFPVLCYKRLFLEKAYVAMYLLIWFVVTMVNVCNCVISTNVYCFFSFLIAIVIVSTIIVAHLLKAYLKSLFSSLIETSFGERCASRVFFYRDYISTYISKGYVIYVYKTEELLLYHSLKEIINESHLHIVTEMDKKNKKHFFKL